MKGPHIRTLLVAAAVLSACGGGSIDNPPSTGGQKLSYAYFQRCVAPLLSTPQPAPGGGSNTCAASGCHDSVRGTGGALRLVGDAAAVDLALPADAIRASDMFKNYTSALGETVPGSAAQSRLLNKPLVRGVLHGGGLVIAAQDPAAVRIAIWINRPMPQGQDEFSSAAASLFVPADVKSGACINE